MKIKRILALLTSTVMLLGCLNVSAFAAGSGDVNGDGYVTAEDADLVMKYVLNAGDESISSYVEGIEAEGEVTDCDGITAKDVAYILYLAAKSETDVSIFVTGGKVGGRELKPISYSAKTKDAARSEAQSELESMTVNDYFDLKFGVRTDVSTSAANNFLNKVYLNDLKLTSDECKDWLINEVCAGVDSSITGFINDFYTALADNEISVEEAKSLFKEFNAVKLSDADIETINNNLTWFRTTFQVVVADSETESDAETVIKSYNKTYKDTMSTVDWYYHNNSVLIDKLAELKEQGYGDYVTEYLKENGTSPTTEQPFKDNVINTLKHVVKPYLDTVQAGGTVKQALDAIGGDRIEITVNEGTLPDVVGHEDTITSYDQFVTAMGDFDDPTITGYIDFSQIGYSFDAYEGGNGDGGDDETEATTEESSEEASTEATSEETSTEATTEDSGNDDNNGVYVLNPTSVNDTLAGGTRIYEDDDIVIYVGPAGASAVESLLWQGAQSDANITTLAGESLTVRQNFQIVAKTSGSVTVTAVGRSNDKKVTVYDTATLTAVADVYDISLDQEVPITFEATAGSTYYLAGKGTNVAIKLVASSDTEEDSTEATSEEQSEATSEEETETTTEEVYNGTFTYTAGLNNDDAGVSAYATGNTIKAVKDVITVSAANPLKLDTNYVTVDSGYEATEVDSTYKSVRGTISVTAQVAGALTIDARGQKDKALVVYHATSDGYAIDAIYTYDGNTDEGDGTAYSVQGGHPITIAAEAGVTYYVGGNAFGTRVWTVSFEEGVAVASVSLSADLADEAVDEAVEEVTVEEEAVVDEAVADEESAPEAAADEEAAPEETVEAVIDDSAVIEAIIEAAADDAAPEADA